MRSGKSLVKLNLSVLILFASVVEHVNSGQSDFRDSQDLASLAAIRQKYGRGKK